MTAEHSLANSSLSVTTTAVNSPVQDAAVQQSSRGVTMAVHIQLGSAQSQGHQLAAALQQEPERVLTDNAMNAAVGPVNVASLQAGVIDMSPVLANSSLTIRQADTKMAPQRSISASKELVQVRHCCSRFDRAYQNCSFAWSQHLQCLLCYAVASQALLPWRLATTAATLLEYCCVL